MDFGAWSLNFKVVETQKMHFDKFYASEPQLLNNNWFLLGFEEVRRLATHFDPAFNPVQLSGPRPRRGRGGVVY